MTAPDTRLVDFIWQELCEIPDRSSPEDQPDMALVCRNDLLCIMEDWNEREALRLSAIEQEQEPVSYLAYVAFPTDGGEPRYEVCSPDEDDAFPVYLSPSVCEGKVTEAVKSVKALPRCVMETAANNGDVFVSLKKVLAILDTQGCGNG